MRRDTVLQFVYSACQGQEPGFGVTAQETADALGIWRNDAAVELNRLVAEGKLQREGKKNIRFFPTPAKEEGLPVDETGVDAPERKKHFYDLVGADGSLRYQLRVAMAAVAYPPIGLNMLITGPTGSGKSHFARTLWKYASETGAFGRASGDIPFVVFNCAEYADNPQLLLSHLFGYKKGAFTGALENKEGLVEQANGGILFLDEIHCLSARGQESFFSLLDSGVFHRVGDNTPRTSRFMLIGATTKPLTDLLETFLRRMPVLISMPSLFDRPVQERLELVEHFYTEEALHIGQTLRIQKDVLNSILNYSLHSNLGILKNLVQLSCAKAFLRESIKGNQTGEISVTFSDLSFQIYNDAPDMEKSLSGYQHFTEELVVPNQHIRTDKADTSLLVDVYDFVESRLFGEENHPKGTGNLQQIIISEIDSYYIDLERTLRSLDLDQKLLGSVLLPGSIGVCREFLDRASVALDHVYPPTTATLLAMHISQYVNRMRSEQPVFPLGIRDLQGYNKEVAFLQENRDWLSQVIHVPISTDEVKCLSVLLHQAGQKREKPPVQLTLASVNDSVAAGMARHLNTVYGTNHVHWLDSTADGTIFQALCQHLRAFHGESGNLIFTDMNMLTALEPELIEATGVPCRIIPILEQRLLMEACRLTLHPTQENLDELKGQIMEEYFRLVLHFFQNSHLDLPVLQEKYAMAPPKKVILSICITGIGSARSIRDILQKRLSYIPMLRIVAVSSLQDVQQIAVQYGNALRLVVGTVDPDIAGVPFISADRVFSHEGLMTIAAVVDDWEMDSGKSLTQPKETSNGETRNLLVQSMPCIAPHIDGQMAVDCIERMTQELEQKHYHRPLPQDVKVRLFMHAASMLERNIVGVPLSMEPEHEKLLLENLSWFELLQSLIDTCFMPFGKAIPRAEVFYFMLSLPQWIDENPEEIPAEENNDDRRNQNG